MSDERVERELFFRSSRDACFVLDVDPGPRFRLSAVNPLFEHQTGLRPADVLGKSPGEYLGPQMGPVGVERLERILATGEAAEYVEQLDLPVGARTWRTRLVPVRDDTGQVHRVIGFSQDVTDAWRAEAALAASERRYRELLQ